MRCIWSIFLLLTIAGKLYSAESNNCGANTYENDPSLFSLLTGYFHVMYTTNGVLDNEIIRFDVTGNDTIYARTTNDGECCRTFNITFGKDYNPYYIGSDDDCTTKVSDSGQIKLLASFTDNDGSICYISWGCRETRHNVHANCDKRELSLQQKLWIYGQFIWRRLPIIEVNQTADYENGKCFDN
ncbi:uncharacterized protein LOC119077436 [Bradysia coprophila]|uniref:uncharacterized protein LOC119077436 n=1 Tax=Bradysia coprophila TaxID=38358 RepID=UPI00187D841B|nr:uncharacterized protein LOC119077436 [Bradysia coprophila]